MSEAVLQPERPLPKPSSTKSKRGRRIMAVILVFLLILLLMTSVFLLRLILPAGKIATKQETGGMTWVRSIYGWGRSQSQQLKSAATVAFTQSGTLLIPDINMSPQVLRFRPDGTYQGSFAGGSGGRVIFPTAINVGPDGRIYVVQGPRDVVTILQPNGTTVVGEIPVDKPSSVAASQDRIVIGGIGGFAIIGTNGALLKVIGSQGTGADQFDQVGGIAIDSSDNVYVVDTYNNRISKYDASGKRVWIVPTGAPSNREKMTGGSSASRETSAVARLQLPVAATLDGNGRLVVVDSFDFSIAVFNPKDGSFVAKYGTYGNAEGEFLYPTGISYDQQRDWFAVADTGNQRVQIVRIPGSSSGAIPALRRTLSGPVRACAIPLVLLLIIVAYWVLTRRRRRRATEEVPEAQTLLDGAVSSEPEPVGSEP